MIRDHLLKRGHDVSVLADNALHRSDDSVVEFDGPISSERLWHRNVDRIDRRLGHHPFTGRRLADQLRRANAIAPIDLIEMEESFGWSGSVARGTGMPVVTRLHGPWFLKPQADTLVKPSHSRHRERAERRAIRSATNLSAPNGVILRATCDRYRLPDTRGTVIPNPVRIASDDELWRLDDCDRDMILFVGRLDQLKGADTMVAAFARILEQRPTAQLQMVGPDGGMRQADGTMVPFADYARQTIAPHVLDRISIAGMLPPATIRVLRRRAGLTVVASVCENFPYAVSEAMATGCPLISTDWIGADDVVADGVTGWLTPVGDAERMAERAIWVMAHPEAAVAAGRAALDRCRGVYGIDLVGDDTIAYYHDVIARHVT